MQIGSHEWISINNCIWWNHLSDAWMKYAKPGTVQIEVIFTKRNIWENLFMFYTTISNISQQGDRFWILLPPPFFFYFFTNVRNTATQSTGTFISQFQRKCIYREEPKYRLVLSLVEESFRPLQVTSCIYTEELKYPKYLTQYLVQRCFFSPSINNENFMLKLLYKKWKYVMNSAVN